MLFAQQLPSVLCQCLEADKGSGGGDGGGGLRDERDGGMMDSLMRGPRMVRLIEFHLLQINCRLSVT